MTTTIRVPKTYELFLTIQVYMNTLLHQHFNHATTLPKPDPWSSAVTSCILPRVRLPSFQLLKMSAKQEWSQGGGAAAEADPSKSVEIMIIPFLQARHVSRTMKWPYTTRHGRWRRSTWRAAVNVQGFAQQQFSTGSV